MHVTPIIICHEMYNWTGVSQTANITESDNEVTTGDENSGLSTNTEEVESMQDRSDTEEAEVDQIEEVEVVPEIEQEMEEISDTDKSAIGDTESESENDVFQGRVFDGCQLDPSFLQPLYSGASINICMTYCIIMQYAYKYKLSYKAMEGLIHLLHLICPVPNALPKSLHKLKQFFKQFSAGFKDQKICSTCSIPFEDKCTCILQSENPGHLIHMSIMKSLQSVVSRE